MNKKTRIFVLLFISVVVGIDIFFTYLTNLKINNAVELRPSYIPKCDKIPAFRGDLRQCDFQNADLKGTDLSGLDFEAANLKDANLSGANLYNVNLQDVALQGADLSGAHLEYAYLAGANLTRANLTGANFYHAHLPQTDFRYTITTNSNFTDAVFQVKGLKEGVKPECVLNPLCK